MIQWDENQAMPFGKYKGRRIKDVPLEYLEYLSENLKRTDWNNLVGFLIEYTKIEDDSLHKTPKEMDNTPDEVKKLFTTWDEKDLAADATERQLELVQAFRKYFKKNKCLTDRQFSTLKSIIT